MTVMKLELAEISDIDDILLLHYKYQINSISEEDKKDGFVTTPFTKDEMTALIEQENGLFIARNDDAVVAYIMAASWQFWSSWPMFAYMVQGLPDLQYEGYQLSTENSYQYGPICLDKSVRGTGLLKEIFEFSLAEMSKRYPVLVTFVNKINGRSYEAHKRKLGLDVISEFSFNNNHYYEMACLTRK